MNIKTPPKSALLTESEMALFVDYYQLTMGKQIFKTKAILSLPLMTMSIEFRKANI